MNLILDIFGRIPWYGDVLGYALPIVIALFLWRNAPDSGKRLRTFRRGHPLMFWTIFIPFFNLFPMSGAIAYACGALGRKAFLRRHTEKPRPRRMAFKNTLNRVLDAVIRAGAHAVQKIHIHRDVPS